MADVTEIVEQAVAPETFDFIDFVKGRSLAEDTVELFTDINTALKLSDAVAGLDVEAKDFVPTDEQTALMDTLRASRIKVHMRAMDPVAYDILWQAEHKAVQALEGKYGVGSDEAQAGDNLLRDKMLSHMIVSVTNAKGQKDERKRDTDEIRVFWNYLPDTQKTQLVKSMNKIALASQAIDMSVDAGFLAKS